MKRKQNKLNYNLVFCNIKIIYIILKNYKNKYIYK